MPNIQLENSHERKEREKKLLKFEEKNLLP